MDEAIADFEEVKQADGETNVENHPISIFVIYFCFKRILWI